ncbi:NADPH:quinone reductase [Bryocella elongata]|uniref:NADPH:quinone reductase n=1 Tax=Bryocella elongata TaxID=863522 RepID=A0A1H6BZC5_9BACT|nr:zinc-binding alcohol dehydrogenase family protein [Bryocella elongata]SEG65785.1 NADPH:quinone reductase [Bryocella elongata]
MKAAIVQGAGQTPVYGEFAEPVVREGQELITVTASSMSHVTKSRAAGSHYSSAGEYPFVAGIDGVGRLASGKRVYFVMPRAPFGAMAERVVVRPEQCIALPDELDDVTAAAIANPGMSAWAAYRERARLKVGETVLVNGATGTAGRLAVQIAKWMGAKKVIATGRNEEALREVAGLGADVVIPLSGEHGHGTPPFDGGAVEGWATQGSELSLEETLKEQFAEGVDVVLDYLWGESARTVLIAAAKEAPEAVPIRFVHIGSVGGAEVSLPGAVLRSSAIELMGCGIGSIPMERLVASVRELMQAAVPAGLKIATTPLPLSSVERGWPLDDSRKRTVFLMSPS